MTVFGYPLRSDGRFCDYNTCPVKDFDHRAEINIAPHNPEVVRFKSHLRNQKRKQSIWTAFSFLERCVPLARNVMRTLCVMSASPRDVRFARIKEHITSLCAIGAIHHCAIALHHLPTRANITLYKRPKLYYNYLIKTKGGISLWVYSVQLKLYFNSEKS